MRHEVFTREVTLSREAPASRMSRTHTHTHSRRRGAPHVSVTLSLSTSRDEVKSRMHSRTPASINLSKDLCISGTTRRSLESPARSVVLVDAGMKRCRGRSRGYLLTLSISASRCR